jgi:putative spermidine/putrescine transport system substrate-binding protein
MRSMPKPQSIRVLTWHGRWGDALAEAVSRPFMQATGIEVEPVLHVGLRLPDGLVYALENSSAAPVDVVWCNTTAALRAAKQGWCESLQRLEVLSELRDRARLQAYPEWPVAQAYVVQHVLVYRTCLYPGTAPQTWRALFDPRHAGRVVLSPGGNGFYPVAQVLGGGQPECIPMDLSPCWSTVAKLRPQLAQPDYSIGLEAPIAQGQIDLCYCALPDALAFRASGLDVDWTVPREGVADTTDALWVPRGRSPDVAFWAREYIAFALSRAVQEHWCALLGALPMHTRASTPSVLCSQPGLPRHADDRCGVLFVPEHVKARYAPAWEATFDAIVSGPEAAGFAGRRAVLSIKHTGVERLPNRDAAATPRFGLRSSVRSIPVARSDRGETFEPFQTTSSTTLRRQCKKQC